MCTMRILSRSFVIKKNRRRGRDIFQCQGYICFKLESDEDRLLR